MVRALLAMNGKLRNLLTPLMRSPSRFHLQADDLRRRFGRDSSRSTASRAGIARSLGATQVNSRASHFAMISRLKFLVALAVLFVQWLRVRRCGRLNRQKLTFRRVFPYSTPEFYWKLPYARITTPQPSKFDSWRKKPVLLLFQVSAALRAKMFCVRSGAASLQSEGELKSMQTSSQEDGRFVSLFFFIYEGETLGEPKTMHLFS